MSEQDWFEDFMKWIGVPPDFLVLNAKEILQFINEFEIPVATRQVLFNSGDNLVTQIKGAAKPRTSSVKMPQGAWDNVNIRGGLKAFHLHYNNEIYLLNDKQAKEFSKRVLVRAQERLSKVNQISFEDALTLGTIVKKVAVR